MILPIVRRIWWYLFRFEGTENRIRFLAGDFYGCSQGGFVVFGLHLFYTDLSLVFDFNFLKQNSYLNVNAAWTGLFSWIGNFDGCRQGGVTFLVLQLFYTKIILLFSIQCIQVEYLFTSQGCVNETRLLAGQLWWLHPRRSHRSRRTHVPNRSRPMLRFNL